MRSICRVLEAGTLAAALIVAITAIDGCATPDCNDTATCPVPGNDASVSGTVDASDGAFNTPDESDGATNMSDAADEDDDNDGGAPEEDGTNNGDVAPVDASDSAPDVVMSDSSVESGPIDAGGDVGVDAPPPPMCHSNLLAPKAATASSAHGTDVASNAIDNNFTTRWDSAHGSELEWIYLDFGASVFVNRVRISWETACGANYDIQTSNDAIAWTTIQSIVGNTAANGGPTNWNGAADHMGLTGFGRYLRINGTLRCGQVTTWGYSIWEMQVYGDTNAMCKP